MTYPSRSATSPPPGGHVRAYRAEMDDPVWSSPELWYLWCWCKFRAAHEAKTLSVKTGKGSTLVNLKPGQFLFGRKSAADELGWPGKTIQNRLKRLEDLGKVTRQPATHYTIVTVCNHALYNGRLPDSGQAIGQPLANHLPATYQPHGHKEEQENLESQEKDDQICSLNGATVMGNKLKDWCRERFTRSRDGRASVFTREHLDTHPDTRDMLLRVGVLALCGAVSEALVEDGCEALRTVERWPSNPGGYLRTVWRESKHRPTGAGDGWLERLLGAVQLPENI